MFQHKHPYPPFLFSGVKKLIVGTLPPPRFTTGELKERDVNFSYGSRDGQLWPILDEIFDLGLTFRTNDKAIIERQQFLKSRKIGICDIVESAEREKVDASDLGMQNAKLRDIIAYLEVYVSVEMLLFTGGNSKNGPEYFFRKQLKDYNIKFKIINNQVPRIHQFIHPKTKNKITTISLTAPSGAANRAVGSLQVYKDFKKNNPTYTTIDFRVQQYRNFF